jgi:hypothetical protein
MNRCVKVRLNAMRFVRWCNIPFNISRSFVGYRLLLQNRTFCLYTLLQLRAFCGHKTSLLLCSLALLRPHQPTCNAVLADEFDTK